jgi:hypothetical protein
MSLSFHVIWSVTGDGGIKVRLVWPPSASAARQIQPATSEVHKKTATRELGALIIIGETPGFAGETPGV